MAEAATIPTTSPKQIGKQLRGVRRRKGLSLSEVARGAGLSRRELVSYERGKVEIPESDLWVLAGSCGVDVNELVPGREVLAIEAGPSSIGDTIEFLRRNHQNGNGHQARAIEAAPAPVYSAPAPAPIPEPEPAPVVEPAPAVEVFDELFIDPEPADAPAPWTPSPSPARPVDVFEELARLPEPVPLNPDPDEYHDFLRRSPFDDSNPTIDAAYNPLAPPPGTFELVDEEPLDVAPVIDDLVVTGHAAEEQVVESTWTPAGPEPVTEPEPATPGWTQPDWANATSGVWNEPDEAPAETWSTAPPALDDPSWNTVEILERTDPDATAGVGASLPAYHASTTQDAPAQSGSSDFWTHQPDPEATSTGFLVDWGGDEPAAPIGIAAAALGAGERILEFRPVDPQPVDSQPIVALDTTVAPDTATPEVPTVDPQPWEPRAYEQRVFESSPQATTVDPAPISWRPEFEAFIAPAGVETAGDTEDETGAEAETAAEVDTHETSAPVRHEWPEEDWTVADDDWELGNALPLVEVRGQGSLVMRRADERWALASLRVTDRYVMEVDVEFRAGPGFGVLFRADVDTEGRMSAYSFDVDPVYEGGAYLVRQWQADRELWNPIAHVPATDAAAMYGDLVVRLDVDGDHLIAYVNGVEVLAVDDLDQASIDRGRDAANGKRVGVQAWSSSDLVVETLRVADR